MHVALNHCLQSRSELKQMLKKLVAAGPMPADRVDIAAEQVHASSGKCRLCGLYLSSDCVKRHAWLNDVYNAHGFMINLGSYCTQIYLPCNACCSPRGSIIAGSSAKAMLLWILPTDTGPDMLGDEGHIILSVGPLCMRQGQLQGHLSPPD